MRFRKKKDIFYKSIMGRIKNEKKKENKKKRDTEELEEKYHQKMKEDIAILVSQSGLSVQNASEWYHKHNYNVVNALSALWQGEEERVEEKEEDIPEDEQTPAQKVAILRKIVDEKNLIYAKITQDTKLQSVAETNSDFSEVSE